jgi:hypothetical protein
MLLVVRHKQADCSSAVLLLQLFDCTGPRWSLNYTRHLCHCIRKRYHVQHTTTQHTLPNGTPTCTCTPPSHAAAPYCRIAQHLANSTLGDSTQQPNFSIAHCTWYSHTTRPALLLHHSTTLPRPAIPQLMQQHRESGSEPTQLTTQTQLPKRLSTSNQHITVFIYITPPPSLGPPYPS